MDTVIFSPIVLHMVKNPTLSYFKQFNSDFDFAEWCFGDKWAEFLVWDADSIDLLNEWNMRHGDLLRLDPDDLVQDSMNTMKELWRQHGNKSKT